jgi:acetylornithine/N-succinyldiaminopimelate aminotransferase
MRASARRSFRDPGRAGVSLAELQALERDFLMPTYVRQPVEFVRGEGTALWDGEGHEYLDFLAGISVAQLGHAHPAIVAAVSEQAGRLMHVGNIFYTEPGMRLAKRLSERSLGGKVFFTNSGAEATECALKLARKRRAGGDIVVVEGAFHGRTYGALSATPQETKQAPFAPLVPGFRVVPSNGSIADAVDERTAAVLLEPIQGESGIHPLDPLALAEAREACDRHGALLVFDEVQCGMGRTGSMWAWEQHEIRPDVMTLAKGLGGGLPIGACVTAPQHGDVLEAGDHGSTFAGGPVPAAAAHAVLDVVDDETFLASVREKGARLRAGLEQLGLDVRGLGLMLAFAHDEAQGLVKRALLDERLVLNATGPDTVRLLPPLTVSESEIDEAVARLARLV